MTYSDLKENLLGLNIGILGTSSFALRCIIPALSSTDKLKLAAIASRNRLNYTKLQSDNDVQFYDCYNSLINDPYVDAVYIPLPVALHYEWSLKALNAGKHVLCEKSLGCSYKEVKHLTEVATSANLALFENFQFRFHKQLDTILSIIDSGRLGELRSIRCYFGFPPFPESSNIRYNPELGGGALFDAGVYTLKCATILLGKDAKLVDALSVFSSGYKVDIAGQGYLVNGDNSLACSVAFGFDHHYQCGVEIWGSKGVLRTNRLFTAPPEFQPEIEIESNRGKELITLSSDNHFQNMLHYFSALCSTENSELRMIEYENNLIQAKLLNDFIHKAETRRN